MEIVIQKRSQIKKMMSLCHDYIPKLPFPHTKQQFREILKKGILLYQVTVAQNIHERRGWAIKFLF